MILVLVLEMQTLRYESKQTLCPFPTKTPPHMSAPRAAPLSSKMLY
jgi:hypothetical protein